MAVVLVPGADWNANTPDGTSDVLVPRTNTVDVTTNLDQGGVYYLSVELARGYLHNLGSSGTYLKANTAKLRILHGGDAWIMSDDDTDASVDPEPMLDTVIDTMDPGNNIYLASEPTQAMNAGTVWYRIGLSRGTGHFEGTMIFASTAQISVGSSEATLYLSAESGNGNALPWLNVSAGKIDSDRTITRCYVSNATMTQNTQPITYLTIGPGGTVIYQHTAGTIIEVLAGGVLDLREKSDEQTISYITVRRGGTIRGYEDKFLAGVLYDERE